MIHSPSVSLLSRSRHRLVAVVVLLCALTTAAPVVRAAPAGQRSGTLLSSVALPVGKFGEARRIAVAGSMAYAGTTAGLHIVDVSTPTAPRVLGTFKMKYGVCGLAVSGHYAFVASCANEIKNGDFYVVDVGNPAAPKLAGSVAAPGFTRDVALAGSVALVADDDLRIVDVGTPGRPKLVGRLSARSTVRQVAADGTHAAVIDLHQIRFLDIANPAAPAELGSYSVPMQMVNLRDIAVVGNYVFYVRDWFRNRINHNELLVIDFSNPATPHELDMQALPNGSSRIDVVGRMLYASGVGASGSFLQSFDISDPRAPRRISSLESDAIPTIVDVASDGRNQYAAAMDSSSFAPLMLVFKLNAP